MIGLCGVKVVVSYVGGRKRRNTNRVGERINRIERLKAEVVNKALGTNTNTASSASASSALSRLARFESTFTCFEMFLLIWHGGGGGDFD